MRIQIHRGAPCYSASDMPPKTQEPRWAASLEAATDACDHCSVNAGATEASALKTRSLNANNMVFSFGN